VGGYEVEVLKGLMTYIKQGKVKRLVMERHNKHLLAETLNILKPYLHYSKIFKISSDSFIAYISLKR